MKVIYNISKLQLIIAWIAGIFLVLGINDGCGYNTSCGSEENAVMVIVVFLLAFYTAGWWQHRKAQQGESLPE